MGITGIIGRENQIGQCIFNHLKFIRQISMIYSEKVAIPVSPRNSAVQDLSSLWPTAVNFILRNILFTYFPFLLRRNVKRQNSKFNFPLPLQIIFRQKRSF